MKKSLAFLLLFLSYGTCWAQLSNAGATIVIEQGATLTLAGEVVNQNTSGTITNSGELTVEGDLLNTGTITSNGSVAMIIFTGTTPSIFTVGNTDLANLKNEKNGADIDLIGNLTIDDLLDFSDATNAKINIGDYDLTLKTNGIITGVSTQTYVATNGMGYLVRQVNAAETFSFPVGNTNGLTALTTNLTGTSFAGGSLKVKVNPAAEPNLTTDVDDYLNRHWEVVAENIAGYENEVAGFYLPTDVVGQENLIEGASYGNGDWAFTDAGRGSSSVTGTITATTATFTGLKIAALPVALASFSVREVADGAASLYWTTASEQNTSHFDVERSGDAINWATITTVAAVGESTTTQEYAHLDKEIPLVIRQAGAVYYRLHIIDVDGFTEYSPIEQLTFTGTGASFTVYPNPTTDFLQIDTPEDILLVTVYDQQGRRIMTAQAPSLNLQELSVGAYRVQVQTPSSVLTRTVIKMD